MRNFITHMRFSSCNLHSEFCWGDSEAFFVENLRTQPQNWMYRTTKVSYKTNELGFREKPMAEIDWENSVVVFGCSHIFGTGLALEHTFCAALERIIRIPVVNLGIPASGPDNSFYNSLILHNDYPKPNAIVQAWSSLDRYLDITPEYIPLPHLPQLDTYSYKYNWAARNTFYVESDRTLWKNKVPYAEVSFSPHTVRELALKNIYILDKARDLAHPGKQTMQIAAAFAANQLKQNGLRF